MSKLLHFRNQLFVILVFIAGIAQGQTIDPTIKYQKVDGWGVSLAWWANLAGGMSQNAQNTLADYAANELNYNVFRFNIGGGENPNCTSGDHIRKDGGKMPGYRSPQLDNQGLGTYNLANDARQIAMMNKIAAIRAAKGDIITETISYSAPWWMTHGLCSAGNVSATTENLKPEFYDDFADYLVSVTKGLKTTYPSWNINAIEPFNEPLSGYWKKGGAQEGSGVYPATQARVLASLKSKLQSYGLTGVTLTAADNTSIAKALENMSTLSKNNPNEYGSLSKICVHSYSGNWQEKANLAAFAAQNGNKPVWQSETGPLSWNLPSGAPGWWIRHYDMAYRLVEDMRNLKASVWCDWQLMSIDDGWGMIQQTNWNENNPYQEPVFKKTRGFYCRKNVTNFIKKGYQLIESSGPNTIAALNPNNTELVIVAVNRSGTSSNYNLDLSKFGGITGFKTYRTSGDDNSSENTTEKTTASTTEKGVLANKALSYVAPPYSVTTFVINIDGTTALPPSVVAPIAAGNYYIKAKHSNKCMSVAGVSSTDGAVIEQWDNNGQDNMKFSLTIDTSGYYQFKPVYNDKRLTVNGASTTNGAAINIYTNSNAPNQKFRIEAIGGGYYRITPQYAATKALAVTANSVNNGADVVLWDYLAANDNFKWSFEIIPNATVPNATVLNTVNGTFEIRSPETQQNLIAPSWLNYQTRMFNSANYNDQKWEIKHTGNGLHTIKNVGTGRFLDVSNSACADNTRVVTWSGNGQLNQSWFIDKINNTYYFRPANCPARALDKKAGRDGLPALWSYNTSNANQQWNLITTTLSTSLAEFRSSFEATPKAGRSVSLQWIVNQKKAVDKFVVQHATEDKKDFVDAETLRPIKELGVQSYSNVSNAVATGLNLYRIKIVFTDGTIDYTEERLAFFKEKTSAIAMYPNPATEEIFLDLSDYMNKKVMYSVVNLVGKSVQNGVFTEGHNKEERIDLAKFQEGSYIIYLRPDKHREVAQKFQVFAR